MLEPDRADDPDRRAIGVILVTSPRCHFCNDAQKLLEDLASLYPLSVQRIDLETDQGVAIAARFRVPFPPVLLINGVYFGHGRISRAKLTRALDAVVATEMSP
ncbi:MAG: hypothetical protein BMS9Abin20_0795 [Acidimicrobiia bacterium]|nr:MAG: hypothetical protein BMS9Abin20_0795 [Acidimicrobiia bacterium]